MPKFNIHNFNLNDYKDEVFKKGIDEKNYLFLFIEQILGDNAFKMDNILSKYYKINDEKSSLTMDICDNTKELISSSPINCTLKNRILQNKVKSSYITKDNFNFIRMCNERYTITETDQIFTGLTYKNFDNFRKFIKNIFLLTMLNSKGIEIYKLYSQLRCSIPLHSFLNSIIEIKREPSNSTYCKEEFCKWVNNLIDKLDLKDVKPDYYVSVANRIGLTNNLLNNCRSEYGVYGLRPFSDNDSILRILSYVGCYYILYYGFIDFNSYLKYVRFITNKSYLSINNIINKTFEYDNFIKNKLNEISYTKVIKKTNPISGFISECNTRVAFEEFKQEEVDKLAKEVNILSSYQQDLTDRLKIKLLQYKKDNDYHVEIVKGRDIVYYYSVANYDNNGVTESLNKRSSIQEGVLSDVSGFDSPSLSKGGTLFNSCMRGVNNISTIKWYANNPQCSLLILTNSNKTLIRGRAVVWEFEDKRYVDRVFTNSNESTLLITDYINKSDLIPIYNIEGLSEDKRKLYSNLGPNFLSSKINITNIDFNTRSPYLDTLRNYKFKYENGLLKTDSASSLSYYLSDCSREGVYYDIVDNVIRTYNTKRIECDICGRPIYKQDACDIIINNCKKVCCKNHIKNVPALFGDSKVIIDNSGKIINITNNYDFVSFPVVYKYDTSNQKYRAFVKDITTRVDKAYDIISKKEIVVLPCFLYDTIYDKITNNANKDLIVAKSGCFNRNEEEFKRIISKARRLTENRFFFFSRKQLLKLLSENRHLRDIVMNELTYYIINLYNFLFGYEQKDDTVYLTIKRNKTSFIEDSIYKELWEKRKNPTINYKEILDNVNKLEFKDLSLNLIKGSRLLSACSFGTYFFKTNNIILDKIVEKPNNNNFIYYNIYKFGRTEENRFTSRDTITYINDALFKTLLDLKLESEHSIKLMKKIVEFYKELVDIKEKETFSISVLNNKLPDKETEKIKSKIRLNNPYAYSSITTEELERFILNHRGDVVFGTGGGPVNFRNTF